MEVTAEERRAAGDVILGAEPTPVTDLPELRRELDEAHARSLRLPREVSPPPSDPR